MQKAKLKTLIMVSIKICHRINKCAAARRMAPAATNRNAERTKATLVQINNEMLLTQHEMPFGMKLRRMRSEIKFDLNMRSIFHIPLGIFHSEVISLDEVEFHCKTQVFRLAFYMAEQ